MRYVNKVDMRLYIKFVVFGRSHERQPELNFSFPVKTVIDIG